MRVVDEDYYYDDDDGCGAGGDRDTLVIMVSTAMPSRGEGRREVHVDEFSRECTAAGEARIANESLAAGA